MALLVEDTQENISVRRFLSWFMGKKTYSIPSKQLPQTKTQLDDKKSLQVSQALIKICYVVVSYELLYVLVLWFAV